MSHPLYSSLGAYTLRTSFSAPPSSFSVGHEWPYYFTSSALQHYYPTAVPSSEEAFVTADAVVRGAEILAMCVIGLIVLWVIGAVIYFCVELARVRRARATPSGTLPEDNALFEIGEEVEVEGEEGRVVIADA